VAIRLRFLLLAAAGLLATATAVAAPLQLADRLDHHRPQRLVAAGIDPSPTVGLQLSDRVSDRQRAALVVEQAASLVGSRYQLGGDGLSSFDCSALVGNAYRAIGLQLPRTSREMIHLGVDIKGRALKPGDLLFFRWQRRQLHVAVYAGNGEIVHASPAERQVTRSPLNALWQRRLIRARRLI
jgi:lipoprotein Spr